MTRRWASAAADVAARLGSGRRFRYIPDVELDEAIAAEQAGDVEARARLERRWAFRREFSEARRCYHGPWSPPSKVTEEITIRFGDEPGDGCDCMSRTLDWLDACPSFAELVRKAGPSVGGSSVTLAFVAQQLHSDPAFDVQAYVRAKLAPPPRPHVVEPESRNGSRRGLRRPKQNGSVPSEPVQAPALPKPAPSDHPERQWRSRQRGDGLAEELRSVLDNFERGW